MLSMIVEMGWPIPSCVNLWIAEQPKVRSINARITNFDIGFIPVVSLPGRYFKHKQLVFIRQGFLKPALF